MGLEGIGEVVTGGLAARAVEPHAGEGRGHDVACLNCGTELVGDYCHKCGQTGHVHRTLMSWWHDFAHGVLHLDGKVWRTLPLLVWKPGQLTRRYIQGERARFVSPIALFLFSVFAMFATITAVGGPFDFGMNPDEFRNRRVEVAAALTEYREDLKELQQARAEQVNGGETEEIAETDGDIAETQQAIQGLEAFQKATGGPPKDQANVDTGWERLDRGIKKINENPALALYKVQNNAYKFSWLLIPLSVPFLWLLFPFRRNTHLYDHTVFVTYSLAFMTMLMVVLSFMRVAGVSVAWIGSAFGIVPLIHMFRQLKGAYQLRWWSAALRTILLYVFASVALGIFMSLLFIIGAIG